MRRRTRKRAADSALFARRTTTDRGRFPDASRSSMARDVAADGRSEHKVVEQSAELPTLAIYAELAPEPTVTVNLDVHHAEPLDVAPA